MDAVRLLPGFTIIGLLLVSLVSGPLVGMVDFSTAPRDESTTVPGTGNATVTVFSVPDAGTLESTRFGADDYLLSVPDAVVRVENTTGTPMLVYKIRIPAFGYVGGTTHVFDRKLTGRQSLSIAERSVALDELSETAYPGELVILKREHEQDTVLYRGNITLTVER